jgi:trans-2,3-dihydro-3-hydroxyanthranilate isomerase
VRFALYDSFAAKPFAGNIAGVVVEPWMDPSLMQAIAAEIGAPATVFVKVDEEREIRIRFFTPKREIDGCGHVTVAAAAALVEEGMWRPGPDGRRAEVETASGPVPLRVSTTAGSIMVELIYHPRVVESSPQERRDIEVTLSGVETDSRFPLEVVSTGLRHLIVPFEATHVLGELVLSEQSLIALARPCGIDTICAFAPLGESIRMRDLCAPIGVIEEPASGTTSAALGSYVARHLLGAPTRIVVEQGVEMGRPSTIEVSVESIAAASAVVVGGPGHAKRGRLGAARVVRRERGSRPDGTMHGMGGGAAAARKEPERRSLRLKGVDVSATEPVRAAALTDDMKRVVREQRLGFVATVCPDGTPNLSPKGTTTVWDDEHLVFADIRSPGTIRNLRSNPVAEVNVVDPVARKGYRFKGPATVVTEGRLYEDVIAFYENGDRPLQRCQGGGRGVRIPSSAPTSTSTDPLQPGVRVGHGIHVAFPALCR